LQGGGKNNQRLPSETVLELVRRNPARLAAWGHEQITLIADAEQRQSPLLHLAMISATSDAKGARQIYDTIAPTVAVPTLAPGDAARRNEIGEAYTYAALAALAGALGLPDAAPWREALVASVKRLSADEQMFRIGGYAEEIARGDAEGALQFVNLWSPALQVRALEDVIPVIALRDLPTAQRLLGHMTELVARPDLPVEADRNDAMYRPTPTHSLDVARISVLKRVRVTDPQAAHALAQKLSEDGYGFGAYQVETATRLPREAALSALRSAFEVAGRGGYGEAGGKARVAALVTPLNTALGEEFFSAALGKLARRGGIEDEDDYRESAAAYAFYRLRLIWLRAVCYSKTSGSARGKSCALAQQLRVVVTTPNRRSAQIASTTWRGRWFLWTSSERFR
jgi:hypothetical protein